MKPKLIAPILCLTIAFQTVAAIEPPTGVVNRAGDQSIILHWDKTRDADLAGYRVFRSRSSEGPFVVQTPALLTAPGFADLAVTNGGTYFYRVTALTTASQESLPSPTVAVVPRPFADDNEFLDYIQQASFDYFWYGANPANGLVPDRSAPGSVCSIAAVGFGLSAIAIGIDHGWIARTQGAARVLTTLNTFVNGPQGPAATGVIGYNGWFYHFLDMNTALRAGAELSSIDTALLLAGILHCKQFFHAPNPEESAIRTAADLIVNRVDWNWMARGTDALALGWLPTTGFAGFGNWTGYNEAMLLYCLGLGAATNPLPASAWTRWTSTYSWSSNYGQTYLQFAPLFGHQYSHCWIDFRHIADAYMQSHDSSYFENSRRATLAQRAYAIANPMRQVGYSSNVWGLTPSDGPTGYAVHGLPPAARDDGTIAPTAAAGSMPFTPEFSLPALRAFYSRFRPRIWTAYGFRDAFNLGAQWYATDTLGIDQGPIVLMIENYRTQRVWRLFMQNEEVQRGLHRAGFAPLPFVALNLQAAPEATGFSLSWNGLPGRTYQVEYSPDLNAWFTSPTGRVLASGPAASWLDNGPPGTSDAPFSANQRFYRVFRFGAP